MNLERGAERPQRAVGIQRIGRGAIFMIKPKNILSNWVLFAFNAAIALLISPFLVRKLGDTNYGILVYINSITGYMGLMAMGIYPTINKYVAEFKAKEDINSLNSFLGTCRLILLAAGIISLIIGIILSREIYHILKGLAESRDNISTVVIIITIQIFASFLFNIYESILVGLQKFDITRTLNLANLLIRSASIYILVYFGYNLLEIVSATLIVYLIECLFQRYYVYKSIKNINMSIKFASKDKIRSVLGFSVYVFFVAVTYRISFQTDTVVIGYYLNASMITYFSIGASLLLYAKDFQNGITGVIFPLSSELHAKNENSKLIQLFIDSTRYSILISIPLCISLFFLGGDFIRLWMGEKYTVISGNVVMILAFGQIFSLSQGCTVFFNMGIGNQKATTILVTLEAIANIILSILLVKKMGIYGVAWGTTIPLIVARMYYLPKITIKYLKYNYFEYMKNAYGKILPGILVILSVILLVKHFIIINTWVKFIISVSIPSTAFFIATYFTFLKRSELDYINTLYGNIQLYLRSIRG